MKIKFYKLIPAIILFFMFTVQSGYSIESGLPLSADELTGASMEQVKSIFPDAHSVQIADTSAYWVLNPEQKKIGRVLLTSPWADKIVGFSGAVPLLIGVDLNENIAGVVLLENRESPEYVDRVLNSGLLSQWTGLSEGDAVKKSVDAVSGATFTSKAVIRSFQKRVSMDSQSSSGSVVPWIILLGIVVLIGFLYYFFKQRKNKKPLI